jgi:RND family efflux transporter MFP subunit
MTRVIGTITTILLGLAIASCGGNKQETAVEEKAISVTVAPAAPTDITVSKTYTGTLEGWQQARIYASIPEAVVELPVREGSEVQAGQAVIVLDREGPASQLQQAKAVFQDAEDKFNKMSRLYEQGAISEQAYNSLKTGLDVAHANYEAARQQVELTSPISGVLTDLSVNIGQFVPIGVPLATVAKINEMRLTIYVDGRSASFLKAGQKAQISVQSVGGAETNFEGIVREVARSADPETRLFRVEIQIDNRENRLSPGMFARATIVIEKLDKVLAVPKESVFFTEGIPKVYTIKENRAEERSIEVGQSTLDLFQVIAGLAEGDNVIVLGRNQVESGSLVKVVVGDDSSSLPEKSKES